MATIDDARDVLVVRIVYDGPALSGKTTSLRALGAGFSGEVRSPEESNGRTLYFDWLDYVGGLFEGRQIRCQIVSVPGQRELAHRRRELLESADAVVLVLDTREREWSFGLGWLDEVLPHCRAQDPPVGLVVQANKRDATDAVSREELRRGLERPTPVAIVESSAESGDGIRETFVLAVRLALDRVRALASLGRLKVGKPAEDSVEELLAKLDASQPATAPRALAIESVREALRAELLELEPEAPVLEPPLDEAVFVPDPRVPGGMIWPPVDGRALLQLVAVEGVRLKRTSSQGFSGAESGFRFHSSHEAVFGDQERGRSELIEWARVHSLNASHLSQGRAVVLADAGRGRVRLWQVVRAEATLRERLAMALGLAEPSAVVNDVLVVASQLTSSREAFEQATVSLPCTLWTVGSSGALRPCYVGLMPTRDSPHPPEPSGLELLERELVPHLRDARRQRVDYPEIERGLLALGPVSAPRTPGAWLSELAASV